MAPPTGTALTGNELNWFLLDKPMFSFRHVIYSSHTSSKWQQTGDLGGATDRTATNNPTICARDWGTYRATMPSTGATVYYFVVNLSGAYNIDNCVVLGHNFASISATSVDLILSTDNLFDTGTNSRTVKTWSSPSAVRLAATELYHTGSTAMSYSGATWAALKITCGSSQIPSFTELWLGIRSQWPYKPNVVWDPYGPLHRNMSIVTADNGATSTYIKSYGQRRMSAEWSLANTNTNKSLVQTNLYATTAGLTRPFMFWETPYSDPTFVNYVRMENEFRWELNGPNERILTLDMIEIPPYQINGN